MNKRAVVLVSGGLDSCVATAIAAEEFELALLHINYGQRTEQRELKAFHSLADHFGVDERLVISMEHLKSIGGSSLIDPSIPVPKADLRRQGVPSSYVPFRNGNMLSVAASWAEKLKAEAIIVGAVEEDSTGYPDCRREFFDAFEKAIAAGMDNETTISILTPVIKLSKAQIVQEGLGLNAPFSLTWSCYKNEDMACGECDSCALRLRGFQIAGVEDPIPYTRRPNYAHA